MNGNFKNKQYVIEKTKLLNLTVELLNIFFFGSYVLGYPSNQLNLFNIIYKEYAVLITFQKKIQNSLNHHHQIKITELPF